MIDGQFVRRLDLDCPVLRGAYCHKILLTNGELSSPHSAEVNAEVKHLSATLKSLPKSQHRAVRMPATQRNATHCVLR
jgi:hypothetical protein